MSARCMKCRGSINSNSAFAILIAKKGGHVLYDIVRANTLKEDSVAMHMNGDPDCARPVSGFKKSILERLGFSSPYDLSFLDYL